jgi:hypothetical protein
MKAKGLKKPQTIAFSGNGSKTLDILSVVKSTVALFAKLIFDGVYGDEKGTIEVKMEENPKIATCKGGLEATEAQRSIEVVKTVFVGNDFGAIKEEKKEKIKYANITDIVKNEVIESVKDFFVFLFDLHHNNSEFFINRLGAAPSIFNEVKEFCFGEEGQQLLLDSLNKGIRNKWESGEVNDGSELEETLFFYPLVRFLHDLAYKISKM